MTLAQKTKTYACPSLLNSWREVLFTITGYGSSVYGLYITYINSWWLLYIPACLLASFFMVKLFCVLHDCTHNSLFKSEQMNTWVGRFLSLFITMPFTSWKREHEEHHSHVVDIERLSYGDVPLWTVTQYKNASTIQRLSYRIFRHPIFFLLASPFLYFFVKARFPFIWTREVALSVMLTNLFVAAIYIPLLLHFGFWTMVFVFMPAAYIGGMIGVALFYLQHDFPDATWLTTEDWNHERASIEGSSLIILPQPLEWFSHAIGYHHIHHLNSKIPGYRLRECYETIPELQTVTSLTWQNVWTAFTQHLWSHDLGCLVTLKASQELKK